MTRRSSRALACQILPPMRPRRCMIIPCILAIMCEGREGGKSLKVQGHHKTVLQVAETGACTGPGTCMH